jgi:3-hydroxyisobutyrate dehydrogenase-like beta-hydroxyacid dehydrogenase
MLDAPLGRSPKEAEEGRLSTYVGGEPKTVKAVRAVMECYADTIVEVGALGMGHTMKLINNFISIGNCAVIAEATATAAKLGVDMRKFCEVIQAGGANSRMFQMVMPWLLEGDDSHLKGPLRIAGKDMRFYARLAEQAPAAAFIAQAVNQSLHLCYVRGHGDRFLPVLPGLLAELNGTKIHDL